MLMIELEAHHHGNRLLHLQLYTENMGFVIMIQRTSGAPCRGDEQRWRIVQPWTPSHA